MKAIITADWHLRQSAPRCRVESDEDWIKFQENILSEIVTYANKKKCEIHVVGDIFDTPKAQILMARVFMAEMNKCKYPVRILAGNHDLPYHAWEEVNNSTYGIIRHAFPELGPEHGAAHFGLPEKVKDGILYTHQLTFPDAKAQPMEGIGTTAGELLDTFPEASWIFCGDYHHSFVYEEKGRFVINPGCITIQATDMIEYKPSIYYVDTEKGEIEKLYLSNDVTFVDDSHIKKEHEREDRMEAFVEKVSAQGAISLDFKGNLRKKLENPELSSEVKQETENILEQL